VRESWIVLFLLFGLSGCLGTRENVHFHYQASKTESRGPLASTAPLRIKVLDFIDARSQTDSLGHNLNQSGIKTGDILSREPVQEIVRAALIKRLEQNGHKIKKRKPDLVLAGAVTEFWAEIRPGKLGVEYSVLMTCVVEVEDARKHLLYSREYRASTRDKKMFGASANTTMNDALSKALDELLRQITADRELYDLVSTRLS